MFNPQKNSKRLDSIDYEAMRRQARAERARYLAGLFRNGLLIIKKFVKGRLPGLRAVRQKTWASLLLIITLLLTGWGLTPMVSANELILADCRFDAATGGLIGTSATLRSAIELANSRPGPDTIHLGPNCIYELDQIPFGSTTDGNTNLTYITDELVIEGFGAKLMRPNSSVFYRMLLVDGAELTIKDTTFENGHELKLGMGGAVHLKNNAHLVLENVSFINNRTTRGGGAISTLPGNVTIRNSHFENNRTEGTEGSPQGGAISAAGVAIDISDSTFINNSSRGAGGALSLSGAINLEHNNFQGNKTFNGSGGAVSLNYLNDDSFVIRNKFFNNEAAESGGGLYVRDSRDNPPPTLGHVSVHNNLWVDQISPTGSHLYLHVVGNGSNSFTVHHNTFVNNLNQGSASGVYLIQAVSELGALVPTKIFNNIVVGHAIGLQNAGFHTLAGKRNLFFDNQAAVIGNFPQVAPIFADPQFVDPINSDYHLKADSDAVDTGTNTLPIIFDLDGNVRPQQEGPDIGAYEFTVKNPQDGPGPDPTPEPDPNPQPGESLTLFLPLVVK